MTSNFFSDKLGLFSLFPFPSQGRRNYKLHCNTSRSTTQHSNKLCNGAERSIAQVERQHIRGILFVKQLDKEYPRNR